MMPNAKLPNFRMPSGAPKSLTTIAGHMAFIVAFLALWELAADRGLLNPTFFGRPSGIWNYLWAGFITGKKLWLELGYTLAGAAISFVVGSVAAVALGLAFTTYPRVHKAPGSAASPVII